MPAKHPARETGGQHLPVTVQPPLRGKGPAPAWGDQTVEERIPSFLESLYFESRRRLVSPAQRPD